MKRFTLLLISFFIFQSAFSQNDSTNTIVYRNDSLSARLDKSLPRISIDRVNYILKCSFTHNPSYHGKNFPYNWTIFLKTSGGKTVPGTIRPLKLFILTDTLIYEYSYLPEAHCWSKTTDLDEKPLSVVVEFMDTVTQRIYFVKAKGPFQVKH